MCMLVRRLLVWCYPGINVIPGKVNYINIVINVCIRIGKYKFLGIIITPQRVYTNTFYIPYPWYRLRDAYTFCVLKRLWLVNLWKGDFVFILSVCGNYVRFYSIRKQHPVFYVTLLTTSIVFINSGFIALLHYVDPCIVRKGLYS